MLPYSAQASPPIRPPRRPLPCRNQLRPAHLALPEQVGVDAEKGLSLRSRHWAGAHHDAVQDGQVGGLVPGLGHGGEAGADLQVIEAVPQVSADPRLANWYQP